MKTAIGFVGLFCLIISGLNAQQGDVAETVFFMGGAMLCYYWHEKESPNA